MCKGLPDVMLAWLVVYFMLIVALGLTLAAVIVVRNIWMEIKGQ